MRSAVVQGVGAAVHVGNAGVHVRNAGVYAVEVEARETRSLCVQQGMNDAMKKGGQRQRHGDMSRRQLLLLRASTPSVWSGSALLLRQSEMMEVVRRSGWVHAGE